MTTEYERIAYHAAHNFARSPKGIRLGTAEDCCQIAWLTLQDILPKIKPGPTAASYISRVVISRLLIASEQQANPIRIPREHFYNSKASKDRRERVKSHKESYEKAHFLINLFNSREDLRVSGDQLPGREQDPSLLASNNEEYSFLHQLIEELPPIMQERIVLYFGLKGYHPHTPLEIARLQGVSRARVSGSLKEAIMLLKESYPEAPPHIPRFRRTH